MKKLILFGLLLTTIIIAINCNFTFELCAHLHLYSEWQTKVFPEGLSDEECILLETADEYTHCCYVEGGHDEGSCIAITDDWYENERSFQKYIRDENNDPDFSIHCSSKYVMFSLFAIFALLFQI